MGAGDGRATLPGRAPGNVSFGKKDKNGRREGVSRPAIITVLLQSKRSAIVKLNH